jgi:polyferredoxin
MTSPPAGVAACAMPATGTQRRRLLWQMGFFILFVMAPVFDVLRYDLTRSHAIVFGMEWRLGLDAFFAGQISGTEAAANILLRLLLPIVGGAALFIAVAWRWGRLYCGWLCPHFSVVETINRLMRRASGKHSLWDRKSRSGTKSRRHAARDRSPVVDPDRAARGRLRLLLGRGAVDLPAATGRGL